MVRRVVFMAFILAGIAVLLADHQTPAGTRPVSKSSKPVVIPGGRLLDWDGESHETGPGSFGLAVSADGRTMVTADGGPNRFSLTIRDGSGVRTLSTKRRGEPVEEEDEWRSVFQGLAFDGEGRLWASDGNSGRVRLFDLASGKSIRVVNLNTAGFRDSYTGDLAMDASKGLLYVVDQANFRVAVVDAKAGRVVSSVRVGRLPFALSLAPDARRLYVTNIGMFEYKAVPGADPKKPIETGLPFPAFGFPSREAERGAKRRTAQGEVAVPGLGSPNVAEANSVAVIDVADPAKPRLEKLIRTGKPFGRGIHGGSAPSAVLATNEAIYVSNSHNDSVTVIDPKKLEVVREVELRVAGLEKYRGFLPVGLAVSGRRLYVAEAGSNAVGVIDRESGKVLGHVPTPWFPTRVEVREGKLYVATAKGIGTGPNAGLERSFQGDLRRGRGLIVPDPSEESLAALTSRVWANNGFTPSAEKDSPLPPELQQVVIIVKENRTFDEVFGDVAGKPEMARFGEKVTPNHHEIARRWAMGDNFYADSEVSVDGHHWIVGSYPDVWTETSLMAHYGGQKDFRMPTTAPGRLIFAQSNSSVHPEEQLEAGSLWHHLDRNGISFRNYGEGFELAGAYEGEGAKPTGARYFTNVPMADPLYRNTSREYPQYNTNIPDQFRADQLLKELGAMAKLPRLIFVHLPNDHTDKPRPADGYPSIASYVADNDYALGRIVEFLSRRPEWRSMAVFITEDDSQGGVDHVDSHRTVLLVASPYAKRGYVTHANASFPGLLKTVFRILRIPPLNLYDATARDLSDAFTTAPDFTPFELKSVDPAIFVPANAREPRDPRPSSKMDDPRVLRRQERE
jgi:YVTN family beta-propeller protein